VREVVAGLVNDRSISAVAAAAVCMARDLGAHVRFVQVVPVGTAPEERAEIESTAFSVALNALHGRPRIKATFEYPTGDPALLLVERSRGALGLVVGADSVGMYAGPGTVAQYCQDHAGCRVYVVGDPVVQGAGSS
jgi:hypothetical protein